MACKMARDDWCVLGAVHWGAVPPAVLLAQALAMACLLEASGPADAHSNSMDTLALIPHWLADETWSMPTFPEPSLVDQG